MMCLCIEQRDGEVDLEALINRLVGGVPAVEFAVTQIRDQVTSSVLHCGGIVISDC